MSALVQKRTSAGAVGMSAKCHKRTHAVQQTEPLFDCVGWNICRRSRPRAVIVYTREDFQKRVIEITGGNKVRVFYDSVGKDTFMKSLDCLAPLGLLAFFGQSSGPVEPLNLTLLAQKGSLFVTRPTLQTYGAKREAMVAMAKELFDVVQSGVVKINININQTYPLKDVSKAHRDLEARKTTGSTVLTI